MFDLVPEPSRSLQHAPASPAVVRAPLARYYRPDPDHAERLLPADTDAGPPDPTAAAMHGAFRAFVLDPRYPCVGARSVVHGGGYRLGVYSDLGSGAATAALARDLGAFVRGMAEIPGPFATFVAMFERPRDLDERGFEGALWAELQALHDVDVAAWDPAVSGDPNDPRFAFSFAGAGFFIVGLHPGSARVSRRLPWPALIFNPHAQFERLRGAGKYGRMQAVIRDRERALQGHINPSLAEFGAASAARQYSGRVTEPDWTPPFQPHATRRFDRPTAPAARATGRDPHHRSDR
jgi:FPC/CPF motif-containing protein YcgG